VIQCLASREVKSEGVKLIEEVQSYRTSSEEGRNGIHWFVRILHILASLLGHSARIVSGPVISNGHLVTYLEVSFA